MSGHFDLLVALGGYDALFHGNPFIDIFHKSHIDIGSAVAKIEQVPQLASGLIPGSFAVSLPDSLSPHFLFISTMATW